MAAYAPRRSRGPVTSPSPRHYSAHALPSLHSSAFASATSSAFTASRSPTHVNLYNCAFASPTHVNLYNCASRSLSFSLDRTGSANRSVSMATRVEKPAAGPRKTCMCSPTTHSGSFRCSLHKSSSKAETASYNGSSSARLNMRRSAMKNSLVRIGTVEGDWVKRALAALIRPSSHQQRRRGEFHPRPSRLSVVTKA